MGRTMNENVLNRSTVGAVVTQRLLSNPDAFKVPAIGLDLFVVRDFLALGECAGLMRMIDRKRKPSAVLGASDPDFRTSETCDLDPGKILVRNVENKLALLTGIEPDRGETIQGQRYSVGQQFKPHHDFFFTDQPYWKEQEKLGGQRTWTAMIFLNTPEAGGQTFFETAGVRITPRAGTLLAWNNLDAAGMPNPYSLHQGTPVDAGLKYIITKWYRERRWGHSPAGH